MQNLARTLRPIALVPLAAALLAAGADAQNTFTFPLDGAQAGTTSTGTGTVTISLNPATGEVSADGTYEGLMGEVLGVHIHGPAPAGQNAPVKVVLTWDGTTSGTVGGGGQYASPADVADILSGLHYVVLHTAAVGAGELRGQIVVDPTATPYGSGPNPADSLVLLSGPPVVASTLTLGIDNPTGSQTGPGTGLLFLALAPDPTFALTGGGTPLPGFGMSGPVGELLINILPSSPLLSFPTVPWTFGNGPSPASLPIPNSLNLVGLRLYAQGALFADGKFGLSNGLDLHLGL